MKTGRLLYRESPKVIPSIDHVLYINLDHRTDRKDSIENVLNGFNYTRIPAIHHNLGYVGASMSHIKALEYAIEKGYNNVLIMEDDMLWNNLEDNYPKLKELMSKEYDVIVLGGAFVSYNPETNRLHQCNSAGAYLVSKDYMIPLLNNFKKGLNNLLRTFKEYYFLDIYWHKLQHKDIWYILPMCYSEEGYSDISNKIINWKPFFLS